MVRQAQPVKMVLNGRRRRSWQMTVKTALNGKDGATGAAGNDVVDGKNGTNGLNGKDGATR